MSRSHIEDDFEQLISDSEVALAMSYSGFMHCSIGPCGKATEKLSNVATFYIAYIVLIQVLYVIQV